MCAANHRTAFVCIVMWLLTSYTSKKPKNRFLIFIINNYFLIRDLLIFKITEKIFSRTYKFCYFDILSVFKWIFIVILPKIFLEYFKKAVRWYNCFKWTKTSKWAWTLWTKWHGLFSTILVAKICQIFQQRF